MVYAQPPHAAGILAVGLTENRFSSLMERVFKR